MSYKKEINPTTSVIQVHIPMPCVHHLCPLVPHLIGDSYAQLFVWRQNSKRYSLY